MQQQVIGNAFTAIGVNQSTPTHIANPLVEPHNFVQSALHISSEALLLLG